MRKRSATIEADDIEDYVKKSKEAMNKSSNSKRHSPNKKNNQLKMKDMILNGGQSPVVRSMPLPDILEEDFENEFDADALLKTYEEMLQSKQIVSSLEFLDDVPETLVRERKESSLTSIGDIGGAQSIGEYASNIVI